MYDIDDIDIGSNLRYYRTSVQKSLADVGNEICKNRTTISRYENNEVIPDTQTLLELCNCFNISLSELFKSDNENNNSCYKLFNKNQYFVYYFTENKLMTSIIDLFLDGNIIRCKMYNGVKDIDNYRKCSYYYEGFYEADKNTAYFNMTNASMKNRILEQVQIVVNIPWTNDYDVCKGYISGLTPNSMPVIKKIIISDKLLTDISKYYDELHFSKDDAKRLLRDNSFIFENKLYDSFNF